MATTGTTVSILGAVRVLTPDRTIELPSATQRRLVAALAVHAPSSVRLEWLCWTMGITAGALRTTVARVRKAVGDQLVTTTATGYRLDASVDAAMACVELEGAAGDPAAIRRALQRWAGPALDEFRGEQWAHGEALRLDEVFASGIESLADALIQRRQADDAIAVLEGHIHAHAFRDRPRGLLLRALAAAGRTTEALRSYQAYRAFLADQVGTDVSDDLRRVERRIAAGWDGVEPGHGEGPGSAPVRRHDVTRGVPFVAVPELVGRRRELAALVEAAVETEQGRARLVLVEGEAGIGKSSLAAALVHAHCGPLRWRVYSDRCDEFTGEPFQPVRGLLGQLVDDLPAEALAAHTALCGGDLAWLLPQLGARVPTPERVVGHDDATARHLLFQAATDVVRRSASTGPVLLIFDDVHWAEPAGLQLLVHLVRNLADVPVMFVVNYRGTDEAAGGHLRAAIADLIRLGASRVRLAGLDEEELTQLVRSRVAETDGRDVAGVAATLVSETAGNPLFAEHLLQHWSESAQMAFTPLAVTVTAAESAGVPASIRDVVWRRVAVLGPQGHSVLSAASVVGVEFEESVVRAMTRLDADELDRLLDAAARAGLIATAAGAPGTSRFTHALVAHSLEAELGDRARARLHAAAFDALVADQPARGATTTDRHPGRLAHHAERAGRIAEACQWSTTAGEDAMSHLAADDAVGWFRRALEHTTVLGRPEAERAAAVVRLGEAEYRAGHPTGLTTLQEGALLAERCGADEVLLRAALAIDPGSILRLGTFAPQQLAIAEAAIARVGETDLAVRARVEALLAHSLLHTDQAPRRTAAAMAALELARACGNPGVVARVAPDVLIALWEPGTADERSAVAAEAVAVVETLGDPSLAAAVYYAAHTVAVCAADADAARRSWQRLRALVDEIDEPRARWTATVIEAFTATMECRFREAEALIAAVLDIGTRIGEPEAWRVFVAQSFVLGTFEGRHAELLPLVQHALDTESSADLSIRAAHAIVSAEVGQLGPPRALLDEVMARGLDAIPRDLFRSTTLLGYAIIALELEDVAAAEALLGDVLACASEVSFNGATSQGPISAYVGKLLSLIGRHDEAEQQLLHALAVAESFGWEYHRASTLLALAQNRGRAAGALDETAREWLTTSEELCAAHGLASWARRAESLRRSHPATSS